MKSNEELIDSLNSENRILKKKLDLSIEARKRVEDIKEKNQEMYEVVNLELSDTIKKLHETQAQLVQSEKMAGLGQLIAGISHEINTPAGAIVSAIEEINNDYVSLLQKLVFIVNSVDAELKNIYSQVCNIALVIPTEYGTSETRKMARVLERQLAEHHIENSRELSKNLASAGFSVDHINLLIPLLKSKFVTEICDSLFILGMTRIHTRDIQIAIEKIVNLVKALKLYSRQDRDKTTETNLKEDINTTLIILHNRIKQGYIVTKEFETVPLVECFASQLNQVWTNILNNAIEAMGTKGGKIIIRLKPLNEKEVAIEFEDSGPGIPEDVLPHIFDAYYTTKPKGEGTGLGLYISKEIINKHHGKIEVSKSSLGGAFFRISLPITMSQEDKLE